jgi:glycosyltransferase involved in cell wall biosynthesis
MKILIVTDAWRPQVNGVVRTLEATIEQAKQAGHEVVVLSHDWPGLKSFSLPTYKEIRLVWNVWKVGSIIKNIKPDAIHIATEGTLGVAAGTFCRHKKIPFTTSYHTKTPEYIKERFPWVPLSWGYRFMRWHHKGSRACLVTTPSMKEELDAWSLHPNLQVWTRGVDYNTFDWRVAALPNNDIPVLTYVGRVAVEKNIEAFLNLPHEGFIKQVIGDGPDLARLKEEYQHPNIRFLGYKFGTDLAREIAKSDCFVFPSKTDTFGIVMIEANACGCPVAAYPVTGPKDFVVNGVNGYLDEDLYTAVANCLTLDRRKVYDYVQENYSWEKTAHIFLDTLVPISIRWANVTLP